MALGFKKVYQKNEPVPYSEIPIMISQSGKLVCIEIVKDAPSIGIVGIRRSGKSRLLHALVDFVHYKREKDAVIVLNDTANETLTWAMESKNDKFNEQLYSVGLRPMKLPVVHCYPATVRNSDSMTAVPDNVSKLYISLRYDKLIEREELFVKSLDKSLRWFRLIKERLMRCKSEDEMMQVVNDYLTADGSKQSREKIISIIRNLFRMSIVSFDDEVVSKGFAIERKTNTRLANLPILMLLMSVHCIPVLMTSDLDTRNIKDEYLKVIIEDLFENQKTGYFYKNQINTWMFIDEIASIDYSKKARTPLSGVLQRSVKEGGPNRIATVWANQLYGEVLEGIRKNTKFLLSFHMNTDEDVKRIMSDFSLTESQANSIKLLDKDYFECVAISGDEHFILYDMKTGERTRYSGYIRGYSIPPMSFHKPPQFEIPRRNMKFAVDSLNSRRIGIFNERTNSSVFEAGYNKEPPEKLGVTSFMKGVQVISLFSPKKKSFIQIGYQELRSYGLEIYSYIPIAERRVFRNQRITYGIKYIGETTTALYYMVLTSIPKDLIIDYDPYEFKVRLRSPNIVGGMTPWRNVK